MRRVTALVLAVATVALVVGGGSALAAPPPAPALAGVTLEGKRLSLADFRGRPVLVNVWSSW